MAAVAVVLVIAAGVQPAVAVGDPVTTPAGAFVEVTLSDGDESATASFAAVTSAGLTTLSTSTTGPAPVGFTPLADSPTYYSLSTTAITPGSNSVCIPHDYTPPAGTSPQQLFRFVDGTWTTLGGGTTISACMTFYGLPIDGVYRLGIPSPGAVFPALKYNEFSSTSPSSYLPGPAGAREAAIDFSNVTSAGVVTMTTPATGPALSGFAFAPEVPYFFDIQSTAVHTGTNRICFTHNDVAGDPQPTHLNVYHFDGGWSEVTSYHGSGTVCSNIGELGLYALGYPTAGVTPVGSFQPTIPAGQTGPAKVQATFENVSVAGTTTLIASATTPVTPSFELFASAATFYSLSTTATVSGVVEVCVPFTRSSEPLGRVSLFALVAGKWTATENDFSNNPPRSSGGGYGNACGTVPVTASAFAAGYRQVDFVYEGPDQLLSLQPTYSPTGNPEESVGTNVDLTFANVTTTGTVSASFSASGTEPSGFTTELTPAYLELAGTPVFDEVEVCLDSGILTRTGSGELASADVLRMYQHDGTAWHDITTTVRGNSHTWLDVCGTTDTLSTIALGNPPLGETAVGGPIAVATAGDSPSALVEFDSVSTAGVTSHAISPTGPAPVGFDAIPGAPGFYTFTTTAVTGAVSVCLPGPSVSRTGIYVHRAGAWQNVTGPMSYMPGQMAACSTPGSLDGIFTLGQMPVGTLVPNSGSAASVAPPDQNGNTPVQMSFTSVEGPGLVSLETSTTGPALSGFRILSDPPTYYDISTTASYSGTISVCISFDTTAMNDGQARFQRLYHYTGSAWEDITTWQGLGQVCGETTSLSPFVVGEPVPTAQEFTATPTPTLSGTAAVGQTLTVAKGTWQPAPDTLTVRWLRDGVAIQDASADTYVVTESDRGARISVSVTGAKAGLASVTKVSAETSIVPFKEFSTASIPTIQGTARVGASLQAKVGTWAPTPTSFLYRWTSDGVAIPGAQASTYAPTAADVGHAIRVVVTGVKAGYAPTERTSRSVVIGAGVLSATPTPSISGSAAVGKTLTAIPKTWGPAPVTLAYRWLRNGSPIPGAVAPTYTLTAADRGTRITVAVTGSKPGYTSVTKVSDKTSTVSAGTFVAGTVTVTGTPKVGRVLTAAAGTWTPTPDAVIYRWFRGSSQISGASGTTYTLRTADVGYRISVRVYVSKTGYNAGEARSAQTAVVTR